jgi:hypothetical protein
VYKVALRGNPELVFGVHAKGELFLLEFTVLDDEYELGVDAYKEYKKVKPAPQSYKNSDLGDNMI